MTKMQLKIMQKEIASCGNWRKKLIHKNSRMSLKSLLNCWKVFGNVE